MPEIRPLGIPIDARRRVVPCSVLSPLAHDQQYTAVLTETERRLRCRIPSDREQSR